MYEDLRGKTAVITGSGKRTGIGYGIAAKLASCGCNVIIADLGKMPEFGELPRTATMEEMDDVAGTLAQRYGVKTLSAELDVADNVSISSMIEKIKERFERIDVLCNNAGASFGVPIRS